MLYLVLLTILVGCIRVGGGACTLTTRGSHLGCLLKHFYSLCQMVNLGADGSRGYEKELLSVSIRPL
jgi:hypothetical protein